MTKIESCHPDVWSNLGCCYFMLGMYDDARSAAEKGMKTTCTCTCNRKKIGWSQILYLEELSLNE